MKSRKQIVLENKIRKMVREELNEVSDKFDDKIIESFKEWIIANAKSGDHPRQIVSVVRRFIQNEYNI